MIILVMGGSGSGKSAFAEDLVLRENGVPRVYLATMEIGEKDGEGQERVRRHREQRRGKGFSTVECSRGLSLLPPSLFTDSAVLLEDLPNLLAGEMFGGGNPSPGVSPGEALSAAWEGILSIEKAAHSLVIVTGDVFREGRVAEAELGEYLRCLGELTRRTAAEAGEVWEVVAGIALPVKQGKEKHERSDQEAVSQ